MCFLTCAPPLLSSCPAWGTAMKQSAVLGLNATLCPLSGFRSTSIAIPLFRSNRDISNWSLSECTNIQSEYFNKKHLCPFQFSCWKYIYVVCCVNWTLAIFLLSARSAFDRRKAFGKGFCDYKHFYEKVRNIQLHWGLEGCEFLLLSFNNLRISTACAYAQI